MRARRPARGGLRAAAGTVGLCLVVVPLARGSVFADTTPPETEITSGPPSSTQSTSASFSFSASEAGATFGCSLDGAPFRTCDPPVAHDGLGNGSHTFRVRATDPAGNTDPSPASWSWTIEVPPPPPPDREPPDTTITSGPEGTVTDTSAAFSFEASEGGSTFGCSLDGSPFRTCDSPAAHDGLGNGSHTFRVRATDTAGNTDPSAAERAWVITPPDFDAPRVTVPATTRTVEANGPLGSNVVYAPATAVDPPSNGPVPVDCLPPSGSLFPLGATTVTCSAADAAGHVGTGAFTVTVVDRVAPVLITRDAISVGAESEAGLSAVAPSIAGFLSGATARDLVDPAPVVTNDAPAWFPIGATTVTFRATDRFGNTATRASQVHVLAPGVPVPVVTPAFDVPETSDVKPPGDVEGLSVVAGDGIVTLRWRVPRDPDFERVVMTRSEGDAQTAIEVYRGAGTTFVDRTVRNGAVYRYLLVAFDRTGNRSVGVPAVAAPRALALRQPAPGARVGVPPQLVWERTQGASYYNVQLFRGKQKVLSAWPPRATLQLRNRWRFQRRWHRLAPGEYRWYVWPGYGARGRANYGPLLGESRFVFDPRPKRRDPESAR